MKISMPTNKNSLAQVSNSFRRFLNCKLYHESDAKLDEWIKSNEIEQLLVVLVDGMGYNQLEKYLSEDMFLRKYCHHKVETVYPTSTVPSTTTVRTGKFPMESGWMGWQQFLPDVDDNYTMYRDAGYYNEYHYSPEQKEKIYPMDLITNDVSLKNETAVEVFPAWIHGRNEDFVSLCNEANEYLKVGYKYAYVYWDVYDGTMHETGVASKESLDELYKVNQTLHDLTMMLDSHVGLIVIADHGHVDVDSVNIHDYPQLTQMFRKMPGLELRCASLFIKDEFKASFKEEFNKVLSDKFLLLSKDEVIEKNLFGVGTPHPEFENIIGDFVACAIDKTNLIYRDNDSVFKGYHGGLTEDERYVPVITFCK
ncbi:alkaline phosphatase family protein [Anaerorhabdus sp.]|uniref:alkaline phosphatase family protein n=1 Tax=Anaerorhabdus sp. TaxID=1872524 RepID=UPI002B1F5B1C|nr:alkaline phosphatase family protein [Anaerorhabdus sp.]MEA4876038.1 alkaline phosphatase family protein [Anaerorhabdus sp.]